MSNQNHITEAEWPIMCALWRMGTATAGEIARAVLAERDISDRTVKSFLRRLVERGSVGYTIDRSNQRLYHYYSLVSRDDAILEKHRELLSIFHNNRISELLTTLVRDNQLSHDEITDLKQLLDDKRREVEG